MEHRIQLLGGLAAKTKNRERALTRYYKSPSICLECKEIIHPRENEKPCVCKKKKFCSQSCAAKYNNHDNPKRKRTKRCRRCSKLIVSTKTYCSNVCRQSYTDERRNLSKWNIRENNSRNVSNFRRRQKLRAVEYMGGKCKICDYDRCSWALDFHHLDPSAKDFNITGSGMGRSWERVKKELEKCVLVCSNCHGEIHAGMHPGYLVLHEPPAH